MPLDLKHDVFDPVVERIRKNIDSLPNIKRFHRTGIEGWFKVEIVAVLGNRIRSLQNEGPDFILEDGTEIELKAATDFHKGFFLDPIRKYGSPTLFLGDGSNIDTLTKNINDDIEIVGSEVISDGVNKWLIGLVRPKQK
jgi:hypothetical protein